MLTSTETFLFCTQYIRKGGIVLDKKNEVKPQYITGCAGDSRACCYYHEKCLREVGVFPDGTQFYTGRCCGQ